MRPFLFYAVVRLGLWVLLWWVLTLFGLGVVLAGLLAALISMLVSILFLDRLRDAAALRWKAADERRAQRRGPDVDEDAEYEDSLLDDAEREDGPTDGTEPPDPAGPESLPELGDGDGLSQDELRGEDR
ncbi:hypothetical protein CFK39_04500 [Brachybacterium avium]|uniref:DUF4229 domain-containing protein n=1 Tax=Brachybacterium avium TaxID=2017485 RepID=A0A220UAX9_9MICO|nr:DUF4229 domain-containing protein [Brachybacterium avium]ASK65210.1 hypothetical protein CFK39_04500 [Brachybacterium avium]